jgi:hypothetical protein
MLKFCLLFVFNRILSLDSPPLSTRREAPRNHRHQRARSISLFGRRTRSPCPRVKLCSSLTNQVGINRHFEHSLSLSLFHTQLQGRTFKYLFIYISPLPIQQGAELRKIIKDVLKYVFIYNLLLSHRSYFFTKRD